MDDLVDCTHAPKLYKLEDPVAKKLRKGQIVTKVLDVIRELVDNSIDAESKRIQVLLDKFGSDKIEVKDDGVGIEEKSILEIAAGGYTSKLDNDSHLSCTGKYGFKGEALSAIISVSDVTINTKTSNELVGRRYNVDTSGNVLSQSASASERGTTVTVKNLFSNYPVRKQWIMENQKSNQMKDIEHYLKSVGIGNPGVHISLYHDKSLIWSKPASRNMEQAIFSVVGVNIASKLQKHGPYMVDSVENFCNSPKTEIVGFLPKKPIDMKLMSSTNNKMSMLILNRKRVHIQELEKLVQKYVVESVEKPMPSDKRRYPIFFIDIKTASSNIDFNLDTDKSKVHLVNEESIHSTLENILKDCYGIDLTTTDLDQINKDDEKAEEDSSLQPSSRDCPESCTAQPDLTKKNPIIEFMSDLPTSGERNFGTPKKKSLNNLESVRSPMRGEKRKLIEILEPNRNKPEAEILPVQVSVKETLPQAYKSCPNGEAPYQSLDWATGRIRDSDGDIIENIKIVHKRPDDPGFGSMTKSMQKDVNTGARERRSNNMCNPQIQLGHPSKKSVNGIVAQNSNKLDQKISHSSSSGSSLSSQSQKAIGDEDGLTKTPDSVFKFFNNVKTANSKISLSLNSSHSAPTKFIGALKGCQFCVAKLHGKLGIFSPTTYLKVMNSNIHEINGNTEKLLLDFSMHLKQGVIQNQDPVIFYEL